MEFLLKSALGLMTTFFGFYYVRDAVKNRDLFSDRPWPALLGTGFITNFFDTLGIGSFAQQTAIFKFFKLVDDRIIPGTMNVGNTIPTVTQAFIFMTAVKVDPVTLVAMSVAAPAGSVLGAGIVSKMERYKIQLGMGFGLLVVALIILAGQVNLLPIGGEAIGLSGWKLVLAIVLSFIFGALQTIGIGFYAPCMAIVYGLGMHPLTAFPIMMTATAMLMAAGSTRFVTKNAYDRKAAVGATLGGIIGVFIAAYIVKSLPLTVLKWIVCGVVLYTAAWMFISASQSIKSIRKRLSASDTN
jgi:uncharacterized membrane protein YfcA